MNWLQKLLLKWATKYIAKHRAVRVDTNVSILIGTKLYHIMSIEQRRSVGEYETVTITGHGHIFDQIEGMKAQW